MTPAINDAAINYARLGWAVFPCRGKLPAIPKREGGRGCLDASSNRATVRRFWEKYHGANIGIATGGKSGFWVLDIDGDEGRQSLATLEAEHGQLPATLRQITGSGGEHYLFSYDSVRPVRNRAGVLPGLDVRGDGGYIVAPPSVHPETRRPYQWLGDAAIAPAPEWLLELVIVEHTNADEQGSVARPAIEGHWGPTPAYSRAALERACEAVARAPIGQQERTLNSEAYSIGRLIASGHMPRSLAFDLLEWAALQMSNGSSKRPWLRSEIREKIARAFSGAQSDPRAPTQGRAA